MFQELTIRYKSLNPATRELYFRRSMTLVYLATIYIFAMSGLCEAATGRQPATQTSLLENAVGGRQEIGKYMTGGIGWLVIALASIISVIEYFQKKDLWIFGYLALGIFIFFFLGAYLSR